MNINTVDVKIFQYIVIKSKSLSRVDQALNEAEFNSQNIQYTVSCGQDLRLECPIVVRPGEQKVGVFTSCCSQSIGCQ